VDEEADGEAEDDSVAVADDDLVAVAVAVADDDLLVVADEVAVDDLVAVGEADAGCEAEPVWLGDCAADDAADDDEPPDGVVADEPPVVALPDVEPAAGEEPLGDGDPEPGSPVVDGVTDGEPEELGGVDDGEVGGLEVGVVGGLLVGGLVVVGLLVGVPPFDGGGELRSGVSVGPSTEP
jgi:hypothetical protein